jgi:hypothetical protein
MYHKKRRFGGSKNAIIGFLEENYNEIFFYPFCTRAIFFFYALIGRFPGGHNGLGFFKSLEEQKALKSQPPQISRPL